MSFRNVLPRPAMIVAIVAMVAALGGSAYAASKIDTEDIANNAVTARQVENDSLKGKDFKAGGLTGSDLRDDKITGKQVNESQLENVTSRWFLLNENGVIEDQSGGFTALDVYDTNTNAYIDAGESMVGKGITATVAIQNQIDLDPGTAGIQGSRNGYATVSRCQIQGIVECAPANAKNENALVVSPSEADGSPAATASAGPGTGSATKRIYVTITETVTP